MRVTEAALLHMQLEVLPGLQGFGGDQRSCVCMNAVGIVGHDLFDLLSNLLGRRNDARYELLADIAGQLTGVTVFLTFRFAMTPMHKSSKAFRVGRGVTHPAKLA